MPLAQSPPSRLAPSRMFFAILLIWPTLSQVVKFVLKMNQGLSNCVCEETSIRQRPQKVVFFLDGTCHYHGTSCSTKSTLDAAKTQLALPMYPFEFANNCNGISLQRHAHAHVYTHSCPHAHTHTLTCTTTQNRFVLDDCRLLDNCLYLAEYLVCRSWSQPASW